MAKQRDRILPRLIEEEMRESFLDYSMSVIVQRALPDVRDGLKPVHRRILYAMHEAGLSPARPHKKSATVVGDVLGKYHPHGDSAVYDALVRMAQQFSLRYPLVDGQGNFGSIDGDSAAAYRYTEAKLSPMATELLSDIERETVDFAPNFDDRLLEPKVLPARAPNLLVNGSSGIAVGMSTNIPPHNLGEVVSAAVHLIDDPACSIDALMERLPGPDFPTGGLIVGRQGIRDAYTKGRGRVVMRARIVHETKRGGREQLVVVEIPYGTNKSRILEQIADLAKGSRLADISDLRDESDRDGIRVVVELKRGADVEKIAAGLFRWTSLQSTFGVITLALEGGVPREFDLKELLERFRDHRVEVIVRRSRWELERARDEVHVLEGLLIALKKIDQVVRLIRSSRNRETAAAKLRKELKLTERQAEAILAMRLSRLTQLEGRTLRERAEELRARIVELEAILASPGRQMRVLREELEELRVRYADARRTRIIDSEKSFSLERVAAEEDVVVLASREGFLKQLPMALYRRRASSGKRLAGMDRYESDYLQSVQVASTADFLLFFTEDGRVHWLSVGDVPEAGRASRGQPAHRLAEIPRKARVVEMISLGEFPEDRYLLFATAEGTVKRTGLDQYARPRGGGTEALVLKPGDALVAVAVTDGSADVVLVTSAGRAIRFPEEEVTSVGRAAQGVKGVKLRGAERVVGLVPLRRDTDLFLVTDRGFARRIPLSELQSQARGGMGSVLLEAARSTGAVVSAHELLPEEDLMAVTAVGRTLRIRGDRLAPGELRGEPEIVVELSGHDRVVAVTPVAEPREEERAEPGPEEGGDGEGGNGEGGNVEGGNVEGGNVEGGNVEGGDVEGGNVEGGNVEGGDGEGGEGEGGEGEGGEGNGGDGGSATRPSEPGAAASAMGTDGPADREAATLADLAGGAPDPGAARRPVRKRKESEPTAEPPSAEELDLGLF